MKKVILIAFLALPLALSAQTKGAVTSTSPAQKEPRNMPPPREAQTVIVELVITENTAGGVSMRFDSGKEQPTYLSDKELVQQLADLRSYAVYSAPDAFNYLNSLGFRYIDSYQLPLSGRSETHLVFQRDLRRGREGSEAPRPADPTRQPTNNPRATTPPAPPKK
jgi:hypothetical protein